MAWGDYDNDGDLDIALSGWAWSGNHCIVYANDGGVFRDVGAPLEGLAYGSLAWGDVDGDGDLDLLAAGSNGTGERTRLYRNDSERADTPPSAPGHLRAERDGDRLILSWSPARDAETPQPSLSYNLRAGTTPGGSQICSPLSSAADGYRSVVGYGNAQTGTSWSLRIPAGVDPVYWTVQAVDAAFVGSPFASEHTYSASTGVEDAELPAVFALRGAAPNPFNPSTTIAFDLPRAADVRLAVYDLAGRLVRTLAAGRMPAGAHRVVWNGRDDRGGTAASGMYLYRLRAGEFDETRRMTLLK